MKSVYVLQCSVGEFGGMPWTEHHLVTSPVALRAVLDELCHSPRQRRENCFFYDTVIGVWVVQRGLSRQLVNLRGFITAHVEGRSVPLDVLISENFDAEEASALPSLKLNWREAERALPPLEAPLMQPGDLLTFAVSPADAWLDSCAGATLGSHLMR